MFFPMFDPTMVLLIPALILAFWAQARVHHAYRKFSEVRSASNLTGAQVARRILNTNGLQDVKVESVPGELSDHYDPRSRTVRLSEGIYNSPSVAALGIAAHEVGHAIQHHKGYIALRLRHAFLMPANLGSTLAMPLFLAGFFFTSLKILMDIGIFLFLGALAFQLITLPVEFNASKRALAQLTATGLLADFEVAKSRKVLNAAALTYVAAAAMALLQLVRLLILRESRD